MALNGAVYGVHGPQSSTKQQIKALSAREKKMIANVDINDAGKRSNDNTNGWPTENESEWRSTPSDIINLKQSINFECSNSIPINFSEAWSFFQTCDMTDFMQRFDHNPPIGNIRRKLRGLVGNPPLLQSLMAERDLILSVASCPMNDSTVHRRILQSIYVFMTKKPSCTRYGTHWEEVGFQGQDPASDLRGVGMFGALQMLYLSSAQETKESLAPEVYELSRHPIHQFPLAVLSLNVTRMALDAFRDGILNRFCNKECGAILVVNRFYLAIMFRIFKKWKDKAMTIHDSCYLLKAVEKWCRANPKKTFNRLSDYLNGYKHGGDKKRRYRKSSGKNTESNEANLSWLDLTKPSLEVFI